MIDPTSASWENHYSAMQAKLLGRELPLHADAQEFPPPSKETEARYKALWMLVQMPELAVLFAFWREEILRRGKEVNAFTSTAEVLRAAEAERACIDWQVKSIVDFIAEFDRAALERAEWMKKQQPQSQFAPPPPPPKNNI